MAVKKIWRVRVTDGSMVDTVLARLDTAAELYGLSEDVNNILRGAQKEIKVSMPIMMDDENVGV